MFFLCVLSDLRALRGKLFKLESDIIHATLFWTGLAMVEFTTAPEKSVRPVTLLIAARRAMPKMMGRLMRGMMQSMMKEMAGGEGGIDPQEM